MKQVFIKPLLLLLVILAGASCDKDEKEIGYDALPQKARQFIAQYFPGAECTRAVRDKDDGTTEYEAWLSDGAELEFDEQGEWTSVDCKFSALPETASCRNPSRRTSPPVTPMPYLTRWRNNRAVTR